MSTFSIFIALILVVCFLLILVVMVQNPKGGGLSSSFGGGGTQQIGGVQKTSDFLDRSTWVLAVLLMILILVSNLTLERTGSTQDSRLLQDNTNTAQPAAVPEVAPETEEIPEIPLAPTEN
ncbi:MAG: preprotein translocase subunit SecG [Flavobacteriaceae bacterium]|jgi:preprotein translocase subunit SecG